LLNHLRFRLKFSPGTPLCSCHIRKSLLVM
jgi:hypothetical protein